MTPLAIIPARSGSKRLPGKNWRTVGGKTLVQRAVESAAGLRKVIVTDDPVRCSGMGCTVLEEPPELASDTATMDDVVRFTLGRFGQPGPIAILLQPTSPLRTVDDTLGALNVWSVYDLHGILVSVSDDGAHGVRRNGAIYIFDSGRVMRGGRIVEGQMHTYVMPPERSVDVNTLEDLERARQLAGGP